MPPPPCRCVRTDTAQVLESIFPDELEKLSDDAVRIRVEPEEPSTAHPLTLYLSVKYPPTYPDAIPELALEQIDEESGELRDGEEEIVLEQLRNVAEESLGMAMTFSIASAAREALLGVVFERLKQEQEEEDRKTREYEEAEAKRTRGTPLTPDRFVDWRKGFMKELKAKREREEEERVRAMMPKEREEWKRKRDRLSGRQLFEQSATLATSDEGLYEEGAAEVDMSQYTREAREEERRRAEDEEERARRGLVGDESDGE
ncbi:hypothetical protein JCM24511_09880 [Saitozyma sp. JCM 24511]|nr:hypothetical protein JCM24511_09880 [Saitozyma sp. JCM 24511]